MFTYENGTTGIKNLDLSGLLENELVIIPDLETVNKFTSTIAAIGMQILYNGHENEKMAKQRDLLLPALFHGDILNC